jgi:PHS family inorganic phosphate transporter-like MFS transporter
MNAISSSRHRLPEQTHIEDPNERRRMALAEVDKAPFGWYHVRLAVVTGIGFFTDAYSVCTDHLLLDHV